ncbi:MAG: type IVB secretion system protein IcmH/DotU [Gammaproteobacteria bacterium]
MSIDDPFASPGADDRTVIKPTPGQRTAAPQSAPVPPSPARATGGVEPRASADGPGLNPLTNAATGLLALVNQLRGTTSHPDVNGVREHVVGQIRAFEQTARDTGAAPETVLAARYALCALLDETVLSTPWGSDSPWSRQTLLSTFHNETWGGEKFFQILSRVSQEPARHRNLLELMYVCLALGFEGKYRVTEGGQARLRQIQDDLYAAIHSQRGDFERELSLHWRGVERRRNPLMRYVPLWVVGSLAAAALVVAFVWFRLSLNEASYPVFAALSEIGGERGAEPILDEPAPEEVPVLAKAPALRAFLGAEMEQGLVDVVDLQHGRAKIIITGDGLFGSGSATVTESYAPLLKKIAEALQANPAQVIVVGHTDNVPMRSLAWKSNWELSRARAGSVAQILAGYMNKPSLTVEGRADTEPLVPNDTEANRARNRRVEILVL